LLVVAEKSGIDPGNRWMLSRLMERRQHRQIARIGHHGEGRKKESGRTEGRVKDRKAIKRGMGEGQKKGAARPLLQKGGRGDTNRAFAVTSGSKRGVKRNSVPRGSRDT